MARKIIKAQSGPYTAIVTVDDGGNGENETAGKKANGRYLREDGTLLKITTLRLTEPMVARLKAHAFKTGETISEITERALSAYLPKE